MWVSSLLHSGLKVVEDKKIEKLLLWCPDLKINSNNGGISEMMSLYWLVIQAFCNVTKVDYKGFLELNFWFGGAY